MARKLNDYEKLFTQGKNISAIQLYRERNGCDLAEAKHAIEEMITAYHADEKLEKKKKDFLAGKFDGPIKPGTLADRMQSGGPGVVVRKKKK